MADAEYTGGCHCGEVRFAVSVDLDKAVSCNCSRCQKLGLVLTFASPSDFRLQSGEDALTDYRFNKGVIAHMFCSACGVEPFARGRAPGSGADMVAVNVRCLDGVEPGEVSPKLVNGRSF